jgi:anti-sigma regulatory factor (Ser/Thr protein kinase)
VPDDLLSTPVAADTPFAPPTSTPVPRPGPVAVELASSPEAASRARTVVRDLLRQGRRPDLVDTACLLTSELVANAVVHAGSPVGLVVDLDEARLAVEVIDSSSAAPAPVAAEPLSVSGRGLAMVADLADAWGVTPIVPGKAVWFSLTA